MDAIWWALMAAAGACGIVLVAMPRVLTLLERHCRERMSIASPRLAALHAHKNATPTMGGIVLLGAVLLVAVCCAGSIEPVTLVALLAAVALGGLGVVDDLAKIRSGRGLAPRAKLMGQIVVTAPIAALLVLATPDGHLSGFGPWGVVLATIWIVGFANAVNLTDGLDGLAGGCIGLCAAALAAAIAATSAVATGSAGLAIVMGATAGAALGFLRFNAHPARVFMGDTGSLGLGGLLAATSLAAGQELVLFLAGGVFIVEAVSVVLQVAVFKTSGRRVLRCAPLHHHFQFLGWSEPRVVRRFWAVACVGAIAALLAVFAAPRELPSRVPQVPTMGGLAQDDAPNGRLAQDARLRQHAH